MKSDPTPTKTLDEFLEQIREEAYCKTELGSRFEKFVKAYLLSDFFGVKFTDVWLWNECPYSHGHDIGIDLGGNGRSALEWIIDRYQIRTDKDSGITNDPNKWGEEHGNPRYIVDLIEKVVRVSVESAKLIAQIDGKGGRLSPIVATRGDTRPHELAPTLRYPETDADIPMVAEGGDDGGVPS